MNAFGKILARLAPSGSGSGRGRGAAETKKSAVGRLLQTASTAWVGLGAPRWTSRSYDQLAREGYRKNVIANRSVKIVAECAASVPLHLYRGDARLQAHAVLDLFRQPNPLQSGTELLETLYAFLQIAGNSYLEAAELGDGTPGELYVLRPDRMTIVPGPNGWPARYEYKVGGKTMGFPVDAKTGRSAIMHLRSFHPQDDYYGLSSLETAAFAVDIHNAAQAWNKSLFDNAARPSGALVFEPRDGVTGELSDEQFARLKAELEDQYMGARNAGRPFLLEGGLKWQQIAFSPQDMEFIASKHVSAREIALAFGVPPMILGIPGDNTYSNYSEANRALWRLTILPLLEKVTAALNAWLLPRFEGELRLSYDREAIPALSFEREALWNRVGNAGFLTVNEKRSALGYEPIEGGDEQPRFDPFASAPGGGPGFFKPGPVAAGAAGHKMKCTGGHDLEVKDRQSTEERYRRLLNVQQDYESIAANDPNVSFRRIWKFVPGATSFRPSHQSADGQTVDLNQPFNVGGESLDLPADTINGSPGNVFDCRCRVEYQRVELNPVTGQFQPAPVSRGNKAILSDDEIANIIFNETASFTGQNLDDARKAIAHAVINADENYGSNRSSVRGTASKTINRTINPGEQADLNDIINRIVPAARRERFSGIDGANRLESFNFRDLTKFAGYGDMMTTIRNKTQELPAESFGPFKNSFPQVSQRLGPTDNYLVIYK